MMAIEITQTSEDKIWVNGKLVLRDMNNNWVAQSELGPSETSSLNSFLKQNHLI
tara:strand:+ start:6857 stop:7018 length:162 start_codon:yes stop_codon:yes gene_type:complete